MIFVTICYDMYDVRLIITKRQKKTASINKTKKKIERRKYPRVDFIRRASYQLSKTSRNGIFTQDISQGGMCLLLDNEVYPGMILKVKFELPGKKYMPINTYAEVIWQDNYLTGVKFIKPASQTQN